MDVDDITTLDVAMFSAIHPQILAVAAAMAGTARRWNGGTECTMDSSGGVIIKRGGEFVAGAYYYGPQSGWIVIIPHHPTTSCATLAECIDTIPGPIGDP